MRLSSIVCLAVMLVVLSPATTLADKAIHARLRGYNEVPAVSTSGRGMFRAKINNDATEISYELTYGPLEGLAMASHIHFGQRGVAAGVSAFLCGGGGKPACPPAGGTVTGVIVAADVVGPAAQGIAAGELDELIEAILRGVTYVNVHTDKHPSGEIRGQIQ